MPAALKNSTKFRFLVVGGTNTLIDFGLLFTLKALGLPAIGANVISTTAAFIFSFFANKKYTFQSKSANIKRELLLFTAVTLFGLWVLQSVAIAAISAALSSFSLDDTTVLLIAKIGATAVSLVWNFLLYSRVVFKND